MIKKIDIELAALPVGVEIMGPPGMEEMTNALSYNICCKMWVPRVRVHIV